MAELDVIGAEDYDEFDESQLDSTDGVQASSAAPTSAEPAEEQPEADQVDRAKDQPTEESTGEEGDDRSHLIARHRYNFQRDQRLAAERQVQEMQRRMAQYESYFQRLQSQQQEPEKVDFDARITELDQQIEDARADGDSARASKLRAEQRKLERQAAIEEVQARLPRQEQVDPSELARQAAESTRLESLIGQLEQQYPILDETNDQFDPDVSEEVMSLYDTLQTRMPLSKAMERAVLYVTRAHGITPADAAQKPARKNVERNIRAAAAQPPEMDGVGMDSAKAGVTRTVDIAKMSQDQFEALSDEEIEKLLATA